ncbi:hypothetical protein A3860_00320 [Niastella vici]|uniref:Peptidase M56 domain-containing protein n=1 Tax=Niastella vici TaxID=1703345 RepID=A0A1V9G870_9BACT|nr:M56 family metallopeptidase [Niastella vici]OQP66849.1 hypothetical protein A3860_00320 [Niastella vici]
MNSHTLLLYVLKSIFISCIFLGYYLVALRNKSFHSYNRFYLLLSMAGSLLIPLFNFSWFTIEKKDIPVASIQLNFIATPLSNHNTTAFPWLDIVFYLAIGISLFLITFFAMNVFKVYQLKRRSAILKMDGIDFIYTNLEHAPFSFLNNLFWKESISMDEEYGKKIFKHELTHIQQKHTLDIIFCQVINAVFWMNPFNWLIQKELKAIHEFIADKEAVGNNNVEDFVKLLLQAHYGKHFLSPTHAFYYSSIKRRLIMLTTPNKTTWGPLRKLLVLPLTLVAVGVLSVSMIERKANAIVAPMVAPVILTQQPDLSPPVQEAAVSTTVKQPKVFKPIPAQKPATNSDTCTPAKSKANSLTAEINVHDKNEVITARAEKVMLNLAGKSDSTLKASLPPAVYYIDNQLATSDEVIKLKPEQISRINVWKGNDAIKKFGATIGANGVIEIFTKVIP